MSSVLWPPTHEPVTMAAVSRSSGVHSTPASVHGLARGDHRELREAVDEVGAAVVEVRLVAVALHFGAVLKPHLGHVGGFDRADAGAALPQRFRELRRYSGPERRSRPYR